MWVVGPQPCTQDLVLDQPFSSLQMHLPVPEHGHQDPVHIPVPQGGGPSIPSAATLPSDLPTEDPHSGAGPPESRQPHPFPNRHHQVSRPSLVPRFF